MHLICILISSLFLIVSRAVPQYQLRSCRSSLDCDEGECCRDRNGNVVTADRESWFFSFQQTGVCVDGQAGPNEVCDFRCGCGRGYTCYRQITGACCPPRRCWTNEAAEKDRQRWRNCFIDKAKKIPCPMPPSAPMRS